MKRCIWILFLPVILSAQKREDFLNLSRDVAILSDRFQAMEKTQNEKLDELRKLIESAIQSQSKITTSMTTLEQNLATQQKALNAPVATMGSKVDGMSADLASVQTSLAELNAALRKIATQMTDMSSAIKTLQAPPAPPGADMPPAGMTAESLLQNATRARSAGQYDLALQQFNDYLRYFGNTEEAASAQYYVGDIAVAQKRDQEAVAAFDQVIERYPDNPRTLDAMYMKGVVLNRMGMRSEALAEFRALMKKAPNSEQAAKARDQLKRSPSPASRKK